MKLRLRALLVLAIVLGCTRETERSAPSPSPVEHQVPIAIAVSRAQPPIDLDSPTAQALVEGEVTSWSQLTGADLPLRLVHAGLEDAGGEPMPTADAAIEAVIDDQSVVALLPADQLRPTVSTARVEGGDPLRDHDYSLKGAGSSPAGSTATVIVGGDVMLGRRVGAALAQQDDWSSVWDGVSDVIAAADASFVNLESTLSTAGPPQQGPDSFGADPAVLDGLRAAGVDVVGLANNHVGDFGTEPMLTTFRLLHEAGFAIVGAGETLDRAREPAVLEAGGLRVGFYATDSIGETPAAATESPGAHRIPAPPRTGAAIDKDALRRAQEDISALAARVDLVIVVPHWGTQYTNVPEPSQREMAVAFAEAGADVVAGGHPHWVQGWQQHGRTTIVHSLGNLIFDMDFMRQTQEGILLEIVATRDRVLDVRPLPYVIDENFTPRLVEGQGADAILELARRASTAPFDAGLR